MAILVRGQTICPLCGKIIRDGEEATLFPHVVLNEANPLYRLSDAACHTACVVADSLGLAMTRVAEAAGLYAGPGRRRCAVCGVEIVDPADYLLLSYLGNPKIEPLGRFNWTHLHRSHARSWDNAAEFLGASKAAIAAGRWRGNALSELTQLIS